jgi:prepilin-type N-terminal cleavage/methylation domain-containing protein
VRRDDLCPPVARTPWRTLSISRQENTEGGFTLIELIIVSVIIPIIIGAITLALMSIFSLQGGVTGRLSGSGDAQIVSTNFETDVQNASLITTDPSGLSPQCAPTPQVSGTTQVLGVQTGSAVISYEIVPQAGTTPQQYSLFRYSCPIGSTTPTSSNVVSSNVPGNQTVSVTCAATLENALAGGTSALTVSPLPLTITAGDTVAVSNPPVGSVPSTSVNYTALTTSNAPNTTIQLTQSTAAFAAGSQVVDPTWTANGANCGASTGWISTAGVTGVKYQTSEGVTNPYPFTVVAEPRASAPLNQGTLVTSPNSSCVYASGQGYYTGNLCFVNFSVWNSYTGATSPTCTLGGLPVSAALGTSAGVSIGDTLSFCLNLTNVTTSTGAAVTGPIGTNAGYNGVKADPFPTYPEAFLGNNGFYTVSSTVDPALYQQDSGDTTTVNIYNLQITNQAGAYVSGWELVTGDAETTDASESITWTSSSLPQPAPFTLLWNSPGVSAVGTSGNTGSFGACSNPTSPLGLTPQNLLTGGSALSVTCASSISVTGNDPTTKVPYTRNGTVMLEASSPTSLTVSMVGSGLEAMFMGILFPSGS